MLLLSRTPLEQIHGKFAVKKSSKYCRFLNNHDTKFPFSLPKGRVPKFNYSENLKIKNSKNITFNKTEKWAFCDLVFSNCLHRTSLMPTLLLTIL